MRSGRRGTEGDTGAPRIAVVGCGAITRSFHLPALARYPRVMRRVLLVDRVEERARELAAEFGAADTAADHRQVIGRVDGAIIAVPPPLHAELALAFLEADVPVLVEKPLATSLEDARRMLEASRARGVPIAVNNSRRLFPGLRKVRELLESGELGAVRRIEIFDGAPLDWPLMSGGTFGLGGSGRGVLEDLGAHALDTVCWWLGETPRLARCLDDARGGSEAVSRVEFETETCRGVVHLSWLSDLDNAFRVEGERAEVAGPLRAWDRVDVRETRGGEWKKVRLRPDVPDFLSVRDAMVDSFLAVVRDGAPPLVSAEDVLPSLELIERCYESRRSLRRPWFDAVPVLSDAPGRAGGTGMTLVTGAGGFIGGRLVEVLHLLDRPVRASVRRWGSAARVGRLPVPIVQCDVLDTVQVLRAMEGAAAVVHCAYGDTRTTVDGTRNVLAAASECGVERVVHYSTMEVYGDAEGEVEEGSSTRKTGWEYADSKIEAEELCWDFARGGLPVTVLRPTLVYGPFSRNWTVEIANRLLAGGGFPSGADAEGVCSLVYVDDVILATLLALDRDEAVGEAFNVNGAEELTWREYLGRLNAELGRDPIPEGGRWRARARSLVITPARTLARLMLDRFEEPIMDVYKRYPVAQRFMKRVESTFKQTPSSGEFRLFGRQARFPIDKARRLLGYEPRYDAAKGIELSVAWLRHHGFAGPPAVEEAPHALERA